MKTILKVFLLLITLTITGGCFNEETTNLEDEKEIKEEMIIDDMEEIEGEDPVYPLRYEGSVRMSNVDNIFTTYVAEASVNDIIEYYRTQAEAKGYHYVVEEVPEDHPYWIYAYTDETENEAPFSLTLGAAEDVCYNCVEWVLYSNEW